MDVLKDIEQKLQSGKQPKELIKEGYAKSSVYYVARKLRASQSDVTSLPIRDELTDLRRRKEIIKLETEIAELEASKGKLPDRVTKPEADIQELRDNFIDIWNEYEYRIPCISHR